MHVMGHIAMNSDEAGINAIGNSFGDDVFEDGLLGYCHGVGTFPNGRSRRNRQHTRCGFDIIQKQSGVGWKTNQFQPGPLCACTMAGNDMLRASSTGTTTTMPAGTS